MRERFREWGAGLSEEDFACALAAFGVLGAKKSLAEGAFKWRFDPNLFAASAADMAKAWRTFRAGYSGPVFILLDREALERDGVDPLWLRSQLLHAAGPIHIFLSAGQTRSAVLTRGSMELPGNISYSIPGEGHESLGSPPPSPPKRATVKSPRRKPENRRLYAQLISLFYPERQRLVRGALRPGKAYPARPRHRDPGTAPRQDGRRQAHLW
jgi:hypothetical protein